MQIFLMWPSQGEPFGTLQPETVVQRLRAFYQPLFDAPPTARVIRAPHATLVYLELPVAGWLPPYYQEDASHWALGLDFPIDADRVLREATGETRTPESVLPALGRALERHPEPLLRQLTPPFVLAWSARAEPDAPVFLQNDGLGFGQLFQYRQGAAWAFTNRIFALKALGVALRPVPEEWAVKCNLGWFPLEQTGYAGVSALAPATRIRLGAAGPEATRHDVLGEWLRPAPLATEECLELGLASLRETVRAAARLWSQASAGLTGGWDSRAVAALLLSEKIPNFYLRTRGNEEQHEVLIASKLAALAGVPHTIHRRRALPPPTLRLLRRSIESAIRWQAGHMEFQSHKSFLCTARLLDGGEVNIMGQHGEIGRGFYLDRIGAQRHPAAEYEERLVGHAARYTRSFLRPALRELVIETIRQAYRQADRYGLEGCDRLDFFYLYERTRRWASGGQYAQPGKVVAPFLNPRYIQAAYALAPALRVGNPFHRHVIACCLPAWAKVPTIKKLNDKQAARLRRELLRRIRPAWPRRKLESLLQRIEQWRYPALKQYAEEGRRSFDNKIYWRTVGAPLMAEVLKTDGLWGALYDPDRVGRDWDEAPDDLAILATVERLCDG